MVLEPMGLITIAFIRIHMVSQFEITTLYDTFTMLLSYYMIFRNYHSAKLIAENICKTTTCKEHYPDVQNEDGEYDIDEIDFLMLSETHIKMSIILQQEKSHNFEVFFKLNKVTGPYKKKKEIGKVSMKFVASNKCVFTLSISPTNHGPGDHSNKQEVSKEIPLG